MRDSFKAIIVTCAVLGPLGISVYYVAWRTGATMERMKPYTSYTALVNLAEGFDYYKKEYGVWPADTNQLVKVRPDLVNDITDGYGRAVIVIPCSEKAGYGEVISYGRDGKPGGDDQFDRDIAIRFPMDTETNAQWNKQAAERFKSRRSRGLP
jgi:hypothetical protein